MILIDCESSLGPGTDNAFTPRREADGAGSSWWCSSKVPACGTSEILLDQIEALERQLEVSVRIIGWFGNLAGTTKVNKQYRSRLGPAAGQAWRDAHAPLKIKEAWDADKLLSEFMLCAHGWARFIYGGSLIRSGQIA
ncbi:hypothetical protein [Streptomyces noursei]|uniref:hypothetical protein n=1 Tax=Streptomyces noursei TaxID=1971 RepID=UPI0021A82EC8|nr:hypothetical protein [Streptomyces noursei]UWS77571.1 hypothetical protein N1H47_40905 [Streptomyces noursei]